MCLLGHGSLIADKLIKREWISIKGGGGGEEGDKTIKDKRAETRKTLETRANARKMAKEMYQFTRMGYGWGSLSWHVSLSHNLQSVTAVNHSLGANGKPLNSACPCHSARDKSELCTRWTVIAVMKELPNCLSLSGGELKFIRSPM